MYSHWRMSGIPFSSPMSRSDSCESKLGGVRLFTDGQRDQQYTIAIRNVRTFGIDGNSQVELTVVDSNTPLVNQELLDLLQHTAQVSMENEAAIVGDFDRNVLRFQSSHRSCNHQALARSVYLDRDLLPFHLFLHMLH